LVEDTNIRAGDYLSEEYAEWFNLVVVVHVAVGVQRGSARQAWRTTPGLDRDPKHRDYQNGDDPYHCVDLVQDMGGLQGLRHGLESKPNIEQSWGSRVCQR